MAQQSDHLDFSGLFKLDVLVHLDIISYSFYEVGLRKFFAFCSDKELLFFFINSQLERFEQNYSWDFLDNPIHCMCFEPSGTWVLIVSDQKILLVPFLPLFIPRNDFDHKWSLSGVTVLPLSNIAKPTSVVWWLTKESENIIVIGTKTGTIIFYSLESQSIVGECKISGEILQLQMCFDDSLDLLALLISGSKSQQWKLILEHRSFGYNWLQQSRAHNDKEKKESFMSFIKQLSKDKITLFIQGGSKDGDKSQTVEYVLKPTEYLPLFRKGSNNWDLTAQYVNGRHFLAAFELNEGTLILESPEEDTPSRTLRPRIKNDGLYIQGLWSQRLLYLLRKNELEIHSANFSVIQGEALLGTKRDVTELWSVEVIGNVKRAHLMTSKEPNGGSGGWREPTFMCDLQLPRFSLESCLVVTTCGAYILNTVSEPCEWLVGLIMRGGSGAELSAGALSAPVPALLRAAADMLMSRGKVPPAHYLYSLSQSPLDGWIARLGVFNRLHELAMYKQVGNVGSYGNAAITIKLLAVLLKMGTNHVEKFDTEVKFTSLSKVELSELASIAAAIGLWELVPIFTVQRGHPSLLLNALKHRKELCRGAIACLLKERSVIPLLLENSGQWLIEFLAENCNKFDTDILKHICVWLNPLQDQLRPVMRDLTQGINTAYIGKLIDLITSFINIACTIESREYCNDMHTEIPKLSETWKSQFVAKRSLSCGLGHWAVADDGNAKIMMANTPVNTDVIGRVVSVACGRHHTLVLTENGIYAAGDNSYGQLGVGSSWVGAIGDAATASGALLHVQHAWTAPLVSISAGHYHSAAIDAGGRLYTWGWGVHGQLGVGSIDDKCTPQLVTKLQGRKVVSVSCGACHTVVLVRDGSVWACGAAVFGQLGGGARLKGSVPLRVPLPTPAVAIAAGYMHNLALTTKGEVWCWGGSPQQIRAAHARRAASPSSPTSPISPGPPIEPHLTPQLVDTSNVTGHITQIAAGWHHSCVLNNMGTIYTWGLNFDGQLGSGDRKQIPVPTEVVFRIETQPDVVKGGESPKSSTNSLVACGGDFTVFIDDDGRIYATGNMHQQGNNEKEASGNRVIMMKTTKRVIKIPAHKNNNKFLFQPIDRIDIMFPFDINDTQRKPIEPIYNPLTSIADFAKPSWADDLLLILKPWIDGDQLGGNSNMAAKLAYHKKSYSECLRLSLDCLKIRTQQDRLYLNHTETVNENCLKRDEIKIVISSIMSKRIKDISLSILNEQSYPIIDVSTYQALSCCCNELDYIPIELQSHSEVDLEENLALEAANVIDKCIGIFPVDPNLWEVCFRLSKDFYLDNNLSISELERVLRKYMKTNATTMAAAVMYSKDCTQYSEILSPKFYLNMCSKVLDTWG